MRYLIAKDPEGGTAYLTNENSASRYGIPNLEITSEEVDGIFGPADMVGEDRNAAALVFAWARLPGRTEEEREAAHSFLRQWPQGPQI